MKYCDRNHYISYQSIINQLLELLVVSLSVANSCCCHDWSSSIGKIIISNVRSLLLHILKNVSHSGFNVKPATSVLWLLLGPGNCGIVVLSEVRNESLEWEWAQALKSQDSNVILTISFSLGLKIVVDLARAKNDFSDL